MKGDHNIKTPMSMGRYPWVRMRRMRTHERVRNLVAENHLQASDVLWPVFLLEGEGRKEPVQGMVGVERLSLDLLIKEVEKAYKMGLCGILPFPVLERDKKNATASEALREDNLMCKSLRVLRKEFPDLMLICDVALDPYTDHGHDGLVADGIICNDETINVLEKMSCVLAAAGADTLAPSDMMDGRIGCIRKALDAAALKDTRILSYSAKYASKLYGPFRAALQTGDLLKGDKKTYQLSPANRIESLRELALDVEEGADMLMVKPAMWYLDIIREAADTLPIPIFAYQVSGEYAMICHAIAQGLDTQGLDKWQLVEESFLSLKRAGARAIITYFAKDWLCNRRPQES